MLENVTLESCCKSAASVIAAAKMILAIVRFLVSSAAWSLLIVRLRLPWNRTVPADCSVVVVATVLVAEAVAVALVVVFEAVA